MLTCAHRADRRSSGTRLINHLGGEPTGASGCTLRLPGLVLEISTLVFRLQALGEVESEDRHRSSISWADDALNAPVGHLVGFLLKDAMNDRRVW